MMKTFDYDLAVYIGRFQPFHAGHFKVIEEGLKRSAFISVLIASTHKRRSLHDPFSYLERCNMIRGSFPPEQNRRIMISALKDSPSDQNWISYILDVAYKATEYIPGLAANLNIKCSADIKIALIGSSVHKSNYYTQMFPQWDSINVPHHRSLVGTPMREAYFSNIAEMWLKDCDGHKTGDLVQDHLVTPHVRKFLTEFLDTPKYNAIRHEYEKR